MPKAGICPHVEGSSSPSTAPGVYSPRQCGQDNPLVTRHSRGVSQAGQRNLPIPLAVIDLPAVLRHVVEQGASDLHIKVGSPPRARVNGDLRMTPFPAVGHEECEDLIQVILPAERLEEFQATGEADFSLSVNGLGRFRGNAFRQRGSTGLVLRRVLPSALSASTSACRRSSPAWPRNTAAWCWSPGRPARARRPPWPP